MLRFRLRTFLIAITLFCLLLGWRISAVESVERPIRELEKLGWQMTYYHPSNYSCNTSVGVYLEKLFLGRDPNDLPFSVWLGEEARIETSEQLTKNLQQSNVWINRSPSIVWLNLSGLPLTDESLRSLVSYNQVRSLNLSSTQLDDSAIDHLAKLTQLESLSLWGTQLSAEGIAELERLLPNCQIEHDFNDD